MDRKTLEANYKSSNNGHNNNGELRYQQHGGHLKTYEMELRRTYRFDPIVGHHPAMVKILKLVSQIADTDATVLIEGESGTGKELIACALHQNSRRQSKSFIPINCGALPDSILESELFGHVKGAFTGASRDVPGWFEHADGGTIFLDEVSEMTPALQVKLLRILQTGEYAPVGSKENRKCNVRVVAATNKDLKQLVQEKKFRIDLYYRLNVIDINIPPLRARKSDIPILIQHFLRLYYRKYGKKKLRLSSETEACLLAYEFPGNVRELENIMQRCVALAEHDVIHPYDLPSCVYCEEKYNFCSKKLLGFRLAKQRVMEEFEREYIVDCLKASKGNVSRAAKCAEINVKNFYVKMTKYDIDPHSYKSRM